MAGDNGEITWDQAKLAEYFTACQDKYNTFLSMSDTLIQKFKDTVLNYLDTTLFLGIKIHPHHLMKLPNRNTTPICRTCPIILMVKRKDVKYINTTP